MKMSLKSLLPTILVLLTNVALASGIEDILKSNLGQAIGKPELQPEYDCDLSVEAFNNENVRYILFAGIFAASFHMAYPLDKWVLDEKTNTLSCVLDEASKSVMNFEFDPQSLKFKKFYRILEDKKTSACILNQ